MAPMDFAIVTGWQTIMKAIFPAPIDGDLLKLLHLSNGFRLLGGVKPLKAGDICETEARIVAVINNDPGKTVKRQPVIAYLQRHGKPQGLVSLLSNKGYTVTTNTSMVFTAPATSPTRRRWSSAATRRYVETVVTQGRPERLRRHFCGHGPLEDELQVKIKYVGMHDGNFVVNVETLNVETTNSRSVSIVEIVKDNPKEKTTISAGSRDR
ncbi:hypothetical protein OH77DRAFT_1526198 [Trametes cingulata]|nr:hypothetical protein OH77DRAFT_1526198 [Trametes cingulata]